jgi:hypothetical protein
MAYAIAIPFNNLENRTTGTFGAHNITKPLKKNMIEDVINIGRLTVPENIVTNVPVRNDMDTISPSSVGSVSKLNSCLMYLMPPAVIL